MNLIKTIKQIYRNIKLHFQCVERDKLIMNSIETNNETAVRDKFELARRD